MKSVVICGSRRYKKEIREFAAQLRKAGIEVYEPLLKEFNFQELDIDEEAKRIAISGVTLEHLQKIRKADVVFIYNKERYVGISTTLEIGAAAILGRPIYAFEREKEDLVRDILFNGIIKTPQELIQKLK